MRAFLSLDLPEACLDALVARIGGLRAGRRVPPENLHLTLSFLDDQPEEALEELHVALEALSLPAVPLHFGGLEWFGPGHARMLAVVVEPVADLITLQSEVERQARKHGLRPEKRPFRPHVTLVRFRAKMSAEDQGALATFLAAPPVVEGPDALATSFSLQGSALTHAGARYQALAIYPLRQPG